MFLLEIRDKTFNEAINPLLNTFAKKIVYSCKKTFPTIIGQKILILENIKEIGSLLISCVY